MTGDAVQGPVFVGSEFVAQYPEGGGVFWVPLQYLLGLLDLGMDAWWVEILYASGQPTCDRKRIDSFLAAAEAMGVSERIVLLVFETPRGDPLGRCETIGLSSDEFAARMQDGLLLNLANGVPSGVRGGFARTALIDIDPGPFQIWALECDMGVGAHDTHLTIGANLGAPDCPVPLRGVDWQHFWPPVYLPAWPVVAPPAPGAPYTTVTQWWTRQYARLGGDVYDCNKRSGYLTHLRIPELASVPIELAANLHVGELEDRALLAKRGWKVVAPSKVAGTAGQFRAYIGASRGELSCAKPAYTQSRSGWLSDRTVCYLASGRPCVLEATAVERHLPASPGLRFFRDAEEAATALEDVERDWSSASRAARALAEEVFSTRVVLPRVLRAATSPRSRPPTPEGDPRRQFADA
jgi:hypothetical protein